MTPGGNSQSRPSRAIPRRRPSTARRIVAGGGDPTGPGQSRGLRSISCRTAPAHRHGGEDSVPCRPTVARRHTASDRCQATSRSRRAGHVAHAYSHPSDSGDHPAPAHGPQCAGRGTGWRLRSLRSAGRLRGRVTAEGPARGSAACRDAPFRQPCGDDHATPHIGTRRLSHGGGHG
jgi:hypothetical protein